MVIFAFFVLDSLSPQELPASQNKHKKCLLPPHLAIFLILTAQPLTEFGLLRTQVIPIPRIPGDPPGEDTFEPMPTGVVHVPPTTSTRNCASCSVPWRAFRDGIFDTNQ